MSWRAIKWAMEAAPQYRLSSAQRLVLLTLAYHHNDKTGTCTPAVDTLAGETGLSDRAVQLATQALAKARLITIAKRTVHGIQTSNQYDLFWPVKGCTTFTPRGEARSSRGGEGNGGAGVKHVHPNSYYPTDSETVVPFAAVRREQLL